MKVLLAGYNVDADIIETLKEKADYVTDSIDQQFENLLLKMEAAMDIGGENEVGVWVSGFYGSGKSYFAKMLGFLIENPSIQGTSFRERFSHKLVGLKNEDFIHVYHSQREKE